jgi:hypothetical protein
MVDNPARISIGKTISGRIVAPERVRVSGLSVSWDHCVVDFDPDSSQRYRIEGLPDGEYSVHVFASAGRRSYVGDVEVRAGESADVELHPYER